MQELRYERLMKKHLESLQAVWSDEEVIRYTNIKKPCTKEEIEARIERFIPFDIYCIYNEDEFIGIMGCPVISREKSEYGVFYQLKKAAWGKGYATEAATWLIQKMRDQYGKVNFYADVVTNNVASEKILNKLDFQLISEEKDAFERNGIKMTIHNYRLL